MQINYTYKTVERTDTMYYVHQDRLGSYDVLTDDIGTVKERLGYDVWGNRVLWNDWTQRMGYDSEDTTHIFRRGFTGHEHLGAHGIINMNGRMYDPNTASFFSPDPFVQAPFNTQSFNRYSYCLNNPLMYTDPDGEWFVLAALYGIGNWVASGFSTNSEGKTVWKANWNNDGAKAFGQGFLAGAGIGAIWHSAGSIPWIGQALQTTMATYGATQAITASIGLWGNIGNGKGFLNSFKIALGNFALDENNFWGGVWQGISRHTWEMPQTFGGHIYTQIRNMQGNVDRVDYFGGATFAIKENAGYKDGVSLGSFININDLGKVEGNFRDYLLSNPLYMHEYGHYIESQRAGPAYLLTIGIPSIRSAKNSEWIDRYNTTHDFFWTETRANRHAAKYFGDNYGVVWNFQRYPLRNTRKFTARRR